MTLCISKSGISDVNNNAGPFVNVLLVLYAIKVFTSH